MKCIADLPMQEFDRQVKFTIITAQTKENKARGYIFLQTQKNPNRTFSANTRAGRLSFPSSYPMELRIIRLKLSTGEYETLATSLPTLGHYKSNKRALPCEIGYRDGVPRVEIYSLYYAYPRKE